MTEGTKIFGKRIPVDPKVFVGALFGVALILIWFNFIRGGDDSPTNLPRPAAVPSAQSTPLPTRNTARREAANRTGKQGTLRMRPIDPSRGDVDPTLKLWLLDRVRAVQAVTGGRNLFDVGADPASLPVVPQTARVIPHPIAAPPPQEMAPPPPPVVNIPLRYFGFVKPALHADASRGYFMAGENILMAVEGDVLESRFLVVALSPHTARLEDIQLKQGQDLPLVPEAPVSQ